MSDQSYYKHIDIFNGDADGICALHQLRLADPKPDAVLVTGVKRDINLLEKVVDTENAAITVLDVSLDSNRQALGKLLANNQILYIDHHYSGEIPDSPHLETHIDPAPEICTSLIVDRLLEGQFRKWAIVGAFGDNLHKAAQNTAASVSMETEELATLRELGELLNYNGYGRSIEDLHFHPAQLYKSLENYSDPLDFWQSSPELNKLRAGFTNDMERAARVAPFRENNIGRIFRFPDSAWCRRVAGVFINEKARHKENLAHALLIDNGDGTWLVSIRAPLTNRHGADELCRSFPTGGGRSAAAGINKLPDEMFKTFIEKFNEVFG